MKTLITMTCAITLGAALIGCASTPPAEPAAASVSSPPQVAEEEEVKLVYEERVAVLDPDDVEDKDRVVCRKITPTGSHKKRTVCRTVAEIEQERRDAQDALLRIQAGNATDPANGDTQN